MHVNVGGQVVAGKVVCIDHQIDAAILVRLSLTQLIGELQHMRTVASDFISSGEEVAKFQATVHRLVNLIGRARRSVEMGELSQAYHLLRYRQVDRQLSWANQEFMDKFGYPIESGRKHILAVEFAYMQMYQGFTLIRIPHQFKRELRQELRQVRIRIED